MAIDQPAFEALAAGVFRQLQGDELATLWLEAERSGFVRINRARLRQAGETTRPLLSLRLARGARQATWSVVLTGRAGEDQATLAAALARLRAELDDAVEDPYLLIARGPARSRSAAALAAPDAIELAQALARQAHGLDLVGFVTSGPLARAFASGATGAASAGRGDDGPGDGAGDAEALHWFEAASGFIDYSIYRSPHRALKATLAGPDLGTDLAAAVDAIARSMEQSARIARWLDLPAVDVPTGEHRALLEPAAVAELLSMFQWDGFSMRAHRTRSSPLWRLHDGQARLDPRVSLAEAPAEGGAPRFSADGFLAPDRLPLIDAGGPGALLVSARTEREFGVPNNGAPPHESPQSLSMAAGELADADALAALGTGLWIPNLWYLNWSDRSGARITGMTRFATLWVRDGKVVGPVAPLRFDDSVWRLFGSALEALGATPRFMPDTSTYDGRNTGSIRAPSMLLRALRITL